MNLKQKGSRESQCKITARSFCIDDFLSRRFEFGFEFDSNENRDRISNFKLSLGSTWTGISPQKLRVLPFSICKPTYKKMGQGISGQLEVVIKTRLYLI